MAFATASNMDPVTIICACRAGVFLVSIVLCRLSVGNLLTGLVAALLFLTTQRCFFHTIAVAVGQVMTRLRLTWLGRPGSVNETTGTYQKILYFTIVYFSVWFLIRFLISVYEPMSPIFIKLMILRDIMSYSFYFISVYLLQNVRYVFICAFLILFSFSYQQFTRPLISPPQILCSPKVRHSPA